MRCKQYFPVGVFIIVLATRHAHSQGSASTDCGGRLTQQSGVITSPNYPSIYPDNKRCGWSIFAADGEVINLRFSRLDFEGEGNSGCPDFVRVYDGDSDSSPVLQTLCGIKSSVELSRLTIRSSRNKLYIVFTSDSSGGSPGFVASFSVQECPEFTYGAETCSNTCICNKENTITCNNINGACSCKRGWTSNDCSQDVDECSNPRVELCPYNYKQCVNTNGSFDCVCRPGLRDNSQGECEVEPSAACSDANSCSHLCVNLMSISQQLEQRCYCPENTKLVGTSCTACSNITFGRDCQQRCPCTEGHTDSCDKTTGGCVCSKGWTGRDCSVDVNECTNLLVKVCPDPNQICINNPGGYECKCKSGRQNSDGSCADCSYNITDVLGVILSPFYPANAYPGLSCLWTILAPNAAMTISLSISEVYSYYGSIQVFDGDNSRAPMIATYEHSQSCVDCGTIMSSGHSMLIYFMTYERYGSAKFNATYSVSADYQVSFASLTDASGNIASPGYPAGSGNSVFNFWKITVAPNNLVTFTFSDSGLGECGKDYLEIYNNNFGISRLARFCGSNMATNVTSSDNVMVIIYSSLGSTNERGFSGNYVTNACKCNWGSTQSCSSPEGPCMCKIGYEGRWCSDINECQSNPCPLHSQCVNTQGSFRCVCWNGADVAVGSSCDDWHKILHENSGIIQSQNYPNNYPNYVNYTWTIVGLPNTVVSLRLSKFDVHPYYKCSGDHLEIYDGGDRSSGTIGRYCGTSFPSLLRTVGNKMHIVFWTDHYYVGSGFTGMYNSHVCPRFKYGDTVCSESCSCDYDKIKQCDNIYGICFCQPGWGGRGCSQDIDECRELSSCPENSDCINEPGSYQCDCLPGYEMDSITGKCQASSKCSEEMRKKCVLCEADQSTYPVKERCYCPVDMVLGSDQAKCFTSLYPHGLEEAKDNKINSKNSLSEPILFSSDIPIGNSVKNIAKVQRNGVIKFGNSQETIDSKSFYIGNNALVPFYMDSANSSAGDIFYHLYEQCGQSGQPSSGSPKLDEVFLRATRDVRKYHGIQNFQVTTVFLATWKSVQARDKNCQKNTFQAVLVGGYDSSLDNIYQAHEMTFSFFIYQEGVKKCLPGQPIQIGVFTNEKSKEKKLNGLDGNSFITFPVGNTLEGSHKCQRYLCKHSDLIGNRHFQAEISELYECPCSMDRLGLQWHEVQTSELNTKCFSISSVAKRRLLQYNQRNRLCCYVWKTPRSNSGEDLLASFQAGSYKYGYNLLSDPWTSVSSLSSPDSYKYARENIEAFNWCCKKRSLLNFCNRFYQVFQNLTCTTHPVYVPASALGDPYILTLDNFGYPMNGWGEYLMMDAASENFTLQARTGRIELNGVLSKGTVFIAFAAKEGDYARFQVQLSSSNTTLVILAGGMDFTQMFYEDEHFFFTNDSISISRIRENNKDVVTASFPCGISIKVHVGVKSLEIDLEVHKSLQNKTRGLLGNFNGDPNDEFVLPNGTVLPPNMTEREILYHFSSFYQVTTSNTAFLYNNGETTADYQHSEFEPFFADEADPVRYFQAKIFCGTNNTACIYDYLATENSDFAENTKDEKKTFDLRAQILANTPPLLHVVTPLPDNNHWLVEEGRPSHLLVANSDPDGDQVTYELVDNTTGVVIDQTGTLLYTPTLEAVNIQIRAKDSRGAYSPVLQIVTVVCPNCNNHGRCDPNDRTTTETEGFIISKCTCGPAYTGQYCETELDSCSLNPCYDGQDCTDLTAAEQGDSPVGYTCGPCPAGSINVDGYCEDIDECLDPNLCDQECINTYRSYACSCKAGFRLDPVDKKTCNDINECDERTSDCDQECINTPGNYTCACQTGYTLDVNGRTCQIDANISSLCKECQQVCTVKYNRQVFCDCKAGYKIDDRDPTNCNDIDECNHGGKSPCSQICTNTLGKFQCSCNPGYKLDIDGVSCLECENPFYGENCSGTCNCLGRGVCDKVRGCVCDQSWTGTNCDKDVNECASPSACPAGLVCQNEPGSYRCDCPKGYTRLNGVCVDIDECADFNNRCDLTVENCVNNVGNYSCQCKPGYSRQQGTNTGCQDINECDLHIDGCEHTCENGPGSYRCVCNPGFTLDDDRHKCVMYKNVCDLECASGCSQDDDETGFCGCPRGYFEYREAGHAFCEDIDECASEELNLCGQKHLCQNLAGHYKCSCEPGYKLENNGRTCVACSGGLWGIECNRSCSCGKETIRCDPVEGCICKPGSSGENCTDMVDRCANGELVCQENEECVISSGNSVCQCKKGFVWISGQCQDDNECLNTRLHNCRQLCVNTVGSYTCACYNGFTLNATSNQCQDVDECQQGNPCMELCNNTEGSYRCACRAGQFLQPDGVSCGSCRNGCPTTCNCVEANTESCVRATGQCLCKVGWTSEDCSVDVDECLTNPCPEYRRCNNLNGSFECVCWNGLQLDSNGTCKDCNRTLTGETGYLMSSNYPAMYESSSNCYWIITVNQPQAVIHFSFLDYETEGCPYDYVTLYDGNTTQALPTTQICVDWQKPFISTSHSMLITFTSDGSVSKRGFRGIYKTVLACVQKSCSHTCEVVQSNPWTEVCKCPEWKKLDPTDDTQCIDINGCNSVIRDSVQGFIVSAAYPAMYPLNLKCYWSIQANSYHRVTFSFLDFILEESDGCAFDYLKIFDGDSESAPVLGQFCGQTLPPNITSTGSSMHIVFNSDDSANDWGFKGQYVVYPYRTPI